MTAGEAAIAVVGIACRFPGASDSEQFWSLLRDGREGLRRLDRDELLRNGAPLSLISHPDHVPVAGIIDGQDQFDPAAFGLGEAEAALMDPQQRLFLECAWLSLDDAGRARDRGGDVGVFAGALHSSYQASNLAGRWDPTGGGRDPLGSMQIALSTQQDYLPLHTAHRLDLHGPAIAVQATCATSLVAVHLAAQSLLAGECDTALAGGASLIVPQGQGYRYISGGIFSRDGRVASYGRDGTGIVYSQGVGCVVLRRLDDAIADRDPILAVLAGSAVNNDGAAKVGFTAPSVGGQSDVIAQALAVAGVHPDQIGLVEGHGTATELGDPIEVAALHRIHRTKGDVCALGSVKSTIGHANAAAGIASFIKVVLALSHRTIPATLHVEQQNPRLALSRTRFRLQTATTAWTTAPYATVSSFGIGGTNAHAVLGPAPSDPQAGEGSTPQVGPVLVTVSAPSAAAAAATVELIGDRLTEGRLDAVAAATTLVHGRMEFSHRTAAVATVTGASTEVLRVHDQPAVVLDRAALLWVLPGGGSQRPGMVASAARRFRIVKDTVAECDAALSAHGCPGVAELVLRPEASVAAANDPAIGLPALFTAEVAIGRLLGTFGIEPDVVIGHSLGEYAAVVLAGVTIGDAVPAVAVRSRALRDLAGRGAMLSVRLDQDGLDELRTHWPDLEIAVRNDEQAVVLTGSVESIRAAERVLLSRPDARDVGPRVLRLGAGAHSALIDPVLPQLRDAARTLKLSGSARFRVISSTTGEVLDARTIEDPQQWSRQLRDPVRFDRAVDAAVERTTGDGDRPWVVQQVGPGSDLAAVVRRRHPARVVAAVAGQRAEQDDLNALLAAAGTLWTLGVPVDRAALTDRSAAGPAMRVPSRPFHRHRVWVDPDPVGGGVDGGTGSATLMQVPAWTETPAVTGFPEGRWWIVASSVDEIAALVESWPNARVMDPATALALVDGSRDGVSVDGAPVHGPPVVDAAPEDNAGEDSAGEDSADEDSAGEDSADEDSAGEDSADEDRAPDGILLLPRSGAGSDGLRDAMAAWTQLAGLLDAVTARRVGDLPPLRVLVITRGGQAVEAGDTVVPSSAATTVLPRIIGQETPGILWRIIDLNGESVLTGALARAVIAEAATLASDDRGRIVAHRGRRRWQQTYTSWPGPRPQPPTAGHLVVLGGLGDVGALVADQAAQWGLDVSLTSRGGEDRLSPSGAANLAALRARHPGIRVEAADSTDPDAVERVLRGSDGFGPATVVIHATGAAADMTPTPLRATTPAQVEPHVRVKVDALQAIDTAIRRLDPADRPQRVLLFSSLGSMVGGVGMAPYCAANGYLDAWAEQHHGAVGPRWISVVWDAWRLGSLGSERRVTAEHSLGAGDGVQVLRSLLGGDPADLPPVLAVSTSALARRVPETGRARPGREEPRGTTLTAAQQAVAELWSRSFGIPVTDPAADFFALGGHSLLGIRMLTELRERFGLRIGLADLLDHPTVGGVAALFPDEGAINATIAPAAAVTEPGQVQPDIAGPRPPENATAGIPLTRVQHAYWVGRSADEVLGGVPCAFGFEFDCPADGSALNLDRYQRAWRTVITRHPLLRSVLSTDGTFTELEQVPDYRIRRHDLRTADPDRVRSRTDAVRRRVFEGRRNVHGWPLFGIEAVVTAESTRLFVGMDALICDGGSFRIIDGELRALYTDPSVALPVPADLRSVLAADRQLRASSEFEEDLRWWTRRAGGMPPAPVIAGPVLPLPEVITESPGFSRLTSTLTAARTRDLLAAAAACSVTPTALLLACYLRVLAEWADQDELSVVLTLFDRPDPAVIPGVDTVVGDFTSLLVHEGRQLRSGTIREVAARVQRRMFSDLDHRRCTSLDVPGMPVVPVVFTSALGLDILGAGEYDPQWVGRQVGAATSTPQVHLDQQVLISGGQLLVQWDFRTPELDPDCVRRAFDRQVELLDELIDTAGVEAVNRPEAVERPAAVADEEMSEPVAVHIDPWATAVPLGHTGPGIPGQHLVLIHPSGGDVLCYTDLVDGLQLRQPQLMVTALTDPVLVGEPSTLGFADLALRHLDTITAIQPEGPYLLGGWSLGGALAQEIARRLQESGRQVDLLVLLDSHEPSRQRPLASRRDRMEGEMAVRWLGSLAGYLGVDLGIATEADRARVRALEPVALQATLVDRLRGAGLLGRPADLPLRRETFTRHLEALAAHRATPLPGPVRSLLVIAGHRSPHNSGVGMGVDDTPGDVPLLGWDGLLGATPRSITLPTDHYRMLPEHHTEIAGQIGDLLAAVSDTHWPVPTHPRTAHTWRTRPSVGAAPNSTDSQHPSKKGSS